MGKVKIEDAIVSTIKQKSTLKHHVFDETYKVFNELKAVLSDFAIQYNLLLEGDDRRIKLEFFDKGEFVALLKVAGDMLVFHMHSNAYEFDRDHKIWELQGIKDDSTGSYVGQIQIYNFLNDSFDYNRLNDLGYLIARVFLNKNKHFFVEGKRQRNMGLGQFGKHELTKANIRIIVETAVLYALQFDLLVQPYDNVKIISLQQVNEEIMNSTMRTGKRLGFQYNSDDVK